MRKIPCVILCGGKSSRMGSNKALLPFPIEPLAIYLSKKLSPFFSEIYLSLKDPNPFFSFGVKTLVEAGEEFAPMIGIREAFFKLEEERIFFVSVDTPFISQEVIEGLLAQRSNGVVYAKDLRRDHYLCGVYAQEVKTRLEEMIEKKDFKMSNLIFSLPHHALLFEDDSLFSNLNTPLEYQNALKRIESHG